MKKYTLTKVSIDVLGTKLFQIKALRAFGDVEKGGLGGYIEKEANLDHGGNAWVSDDARVSGDAWVYGDAQVSGNAWVSGDAQVYGNAQVSGDARVYADAQVSGNAWVYGDAQVSGKLSIKAGFFFGMRYDKEEIKQFEIEDGTELIYKGDADISFQDEEKETKNPKEIVIDGATYILKKAK